MSATWPAPAICPPRLYLNLSCSDLSIRCSDNLTAGACCSRKSRLPAGGRIRPGPINLRHLQFEVVVPRHLHCRDSATHPARRHKARPNSTRQLQNTKREPRRRIWDLASCTAGLQVAEAGATYEQAGRQRTTWLFRIPSRPSAIDNAAAKTQAPGQGRPRSLGNLILPGGAK